MAETRNVKLVSRSQVADVLGVTTRTLQNWNIPQADGPDRKAVWHRGEDVREYVERVAYEKGLAAGRGQGPAFADDDGLQIDVELEKARKLKAERIGQEIKNAQALGELAPVDMLTSALGDAISHMNTHLESVPASIKRVWPECPGHVLDAIEREIAKLRGTIADARIEFTDPAMGGGWTDGQGADDQGVPSGQGGSSADGE